MGSTNNAIPNRIMSGIYSRRRAAEAEGYMTVFIPVD